jgi:peptidyl-prolyl cis-trans isomerase NIMA-interacting 1
MKSAPLFARAVVLPALGAAAVLACASAGPNPASPPAATSPTEAGTNPAASASSAPAPVTLDVSGSGMTALGTASKTSASSDAAVTESKPDHIAARHVLIQYMRAKSAPLSVVRTKEQAYQVAQEVLKRAKAGDDFARLALEYSDEPNAGQRGGSLGRFGHGQMDRQFEDAAFALSVGQFSGIVETPFGFHIIQRTE